MAHFSMFRLLSLAFDLMFLSSLAILILGGAENEFVFLPITFALSGIIVQAILLRQFSLIKRTDAVDTKACRYCNRAVSTDAKICRFCLTEVGEHSASSAEVTSQAGIQDLQSQTERWRAATNAKL